MPSYATLEAQREALLEKTTLETNVKQDARAEIKQARDELETVERLLRAS